MADGGDSGVHCVYRTCELLRAVGSEPGAVVSGRDGHSHPREDYGIAAGGSGYAVLCEWAYGSGRNCASGGAVGTSMKMGETRVNIGRIR